MSPAITSWKRRGAARATTRPIRPASCSLTHDHRYYEPKLKEPETTRFIVTGGAGAPLSGCPKNPDDGAYYHYVKVVVNGADVTATVVPINGTTPCGNP